MAAIIEGLPPQVPETNTFRYVYVLTAEFEETQEATDNMLAFWEFCRQWFQETTGLIPRWDPNMYVIRAPWTRSWVRQNVGTDANVLDAIYWGDTGKAPYPAEVLYGGEFGQPAFRSDSAFAQSGDAYVVMAMGYFASIHGAHGAIWRGDTRRRNVDTLLGDTHAALGVPHGLNFPNSRALTWHELGHGCWGFPDSGPMSVPGSIMNAREGGVDPVDATFDEEVHIPVMATSPWIIPAEVLIPPVPVIQQGVPAMGWEALGLGATVQEV